MQLPGRRVPSFQPRRPQVGLQDLTGSQGKGQQGAWGCNSLAPGSFAAGLAGLTYSARLADCATPRPVATRQLRMPICEEKDLPCPPSPRPAAPVPHVAPQGQGHLCTPRQHSLVHVMCVHSRPRPVPCQVLRLRFAGRQLCRPWFRQHSLVHAVACAPSAAPSALSGAEPSRRRPITPPPLAWSLDC